MPLLTHHPLKALYTTLILLTTLLSLPFYTLYFLFRRPHPTWSLRQSLTTHTARSFLSLLATIQPKPSPPPLPPSSSSSSSKASASTSTTTTIPIAHKIHYQPPLLSSPTIHPAPITGTWYPHPPPPEYTGEIILHFHGGGYTIGTGSPADAGYAAKTLLNIAEHVFMPAYRLASSARGRGAFPAALLDAVSAYVFLLEMWRPERVVLSGDSAGGHLVLGLLKYISSQKSALGVPRAVLVWSGAVDYLALSDEGVVDGSARFGSDYIPGKFAAWGARRLVEGVDLGDESVVGYLRLLGSPFETKVPLWICVGEVEVLAEGALEFGWQMRGVEGNVVGVKVLKDTPHDVMLMGNMLGFEREAEEGARAAKAFVENVKETKLLD